MKTFLVAFVIAISLIGRVGLAQTWAPIGDLSQGISVDIDSIHAQAGSEGVVEITWRFGLNSEIQTQYESVLDCPSFQITTNTSQFFPRFGSVGQKQNLMLPTESKFVINERYTFPAWIGFKSSLLTFACPRIVPGWASLWSFPAPVGLCKGTLSLLNQRICSGETESLATFNLITLRSAQLKAACGNTFEDLATVVGSALDKAGRCRDTPGISQDRCIKNELFGTLQGMGMDLASVKNGGSCIFVGNALTSMKREQEKSRAFARAQNYLQCARLAAPQLDDRISNADTIAIAVHSKCRSVLQEALSISQELAPLTDVLAQEMRPKIIEFVLEGRVKRNRQPTRPENQQKQKATSM